MEDHSKNRMVRSDRQPYITAYKGVLIENLTREELIQAIQELGKMYQDFMASKEAERLFWSDITKR